MNVRGVVLGVQAAVPALRADRRRDHGDVLGVGAVRRPGMWAYNTTKGGAVNLVRTAAFDLGPEGSACNGVCPGPIAGTGMTSRSRRGNPELYEGMRVHVPLQRWGRPEEVAAAARVPPVGRRVVHHRCAAPGRRRRDRGHGAVRAPRLHCSAEIGMDPELLAAARVAVGFMPDDEGLALHDAGVDGGRVGPLLEIGTYCGKSAVYLGAAARAGRHGVLHRRPPPRLGGEPGRLGAPRPEVVDPETGRMDTLPFFRRTIDAAGLEDVVVAVVGDSPRRARVWRTPLGFLFIDGGHAEDVAHGRLRRTGRRTSRPAACSRSTTCSRTRPTAAKPGPCVWQHAVRQTRRPLARWTTTGSLRVLRRILSAQFGSKISSRFGLSITRGAVRGSGVRPSRPEPDSRIQGGAT